MPTLVACFFIPFRQCTLLLLLARASASQLTILAETWRCVRDSFRSANLDQPRAIKPSNNFQLTANAGEQLATVLEGAARC